MLILTLLMTAFSIVSAVVLLFAYLFFLPHMRKTLTGRIACAALLASLCGLQLMHIDFLLDGTPLFESRLYALLLLATPPAFFFFSREILIPEPSRSPLQAAHVLPLLLAFVAAPHTAAPVAFAIGAGYAVWFTHLVYGMRRHVRRFRFEMFFFGFFAVVAIAVLVLGLLLPYIEPATFHLAYANMTGVAFVLIVAALIVFPEITSDIAEAAALSYASSTLNDVDVDERLRRLDKLMAEDKLYQNESLNLGMLAEALDLSSHQLSELINTRFGIGFSRYIREQRVAEAQRLLAADRSSSVLAISLATGFRSQSNFYAAFREITGEAPGNWRRKLGSG